MKILLNNLDDEKLELLLKEIIASPNVIGEWEYSFLFDVVKKGEPPVTGSKILMSSINILAKYNDHNKLEKISIDNDSDYLITRDDNLDYVDNYNQEDINNIVLVKVQDFLERGNQDER